jgi:hypothetical protein
MGISAIIPIALQALQGVMGASAAASEGQAAQELADDQVAELERQKEEERLTARSKKSDRAREADRKFASMIASMADNGGAGTGNASAFAGEIGFISGVDQARISGNSISKIAGLSAQQNAARAKARNASTRASGNMFSSLLSAAGGIAGTVAKEQERKRQQKKQKNTAGKKV